MRYVKLAALVFNLLPLAAIAGVCDNQFSYGRSNVPFDISGAAGSGYYAGIKISDDGQERVVIGMMNNLGEIISEYHFRTLGCLIGFHPYDRPLPLPYWKQKEHIYAVGGGGAGGTGYLEINWKAGTSLRVN